MPKHPAITSERPLKLETIDRMERERQQLTRQPITPAAVDSDIDYLRRRRPKQD